MPAKPRIAYLFSRYPVVSQTFCDSEMLALESMGFDIEVASLYRPRNSFRHERLDRLKAEIHHLPTTDVLDALADDPEFQRALGPLIKDHDQRYGASFKPASLARNAWYFAGLFRRLGVQHVHVHFANRATHTALFLRKLGFSFSFTAHAQDFMFDLGSKELLAEMAREAEFVVAVSEFSRQLLCEQCPDSADKMVRIFNGIEVADFSAVPVRERPVLRIVSIGRLIEFKGFQHLINAAGILKQRGVPVDIRIIGDGPARPQLEAQIVALGVQDTVRLLGVRSQDEVKRELADCDLFALASIVDSMGASDILPTVITEAMASSLPVVSTRVTGIPEMVVHGETGLLVEPADEAGLASSIAELAADPGTRERMGKAGRERAEVLFAFPKTAGVLGEHFLARARRTPADKTARAITPLVYLCHRWKGEPFAREAPGLAEGVRWIAEHSAWPALDGDRATLQTMESMPDACVVESIWLRRTQDRIKLEAARTRMGDAVDSVLFYQCARNAVYLADVLPRREVRLVHAHRSDAAVTVWMLKQLRPDLKITAAIEEEPVMPRGLLSRLLKDFELVSLSDPQLNEQLGGKHPNVLKLQTPFTRTELRLGPFKLKTKKAAAPVNRREVEFAWLKMLKEVMA